ncbi:hypothetical protein VNO77_42013 [Canavalia gladiata]|uniref:SOSEKI DIX-like domain-containing protein n=1 Tax=Canavalia gladiata TaxID=3824 RepID=A0AAN9K0U6_CANGL
METSLISLLLWEKQVVLHVTLHPKCCQCQAILEVNGYSPIIGPKPPKVSAIDIVKVDDVNLATNFMEACLSSPHELCLKDIINCLNLFLRKSTGTMYSWSAKWSYKNGFIWHNLLENKFIYPAQKEGYILKGSKILDNAASIMRLQQLKDNSNSLIMIIRRHNKSWCSIDLNKYQVYKFELIEGQS